MNDYIIPQNSEYSRLLQDIRAILTEHEFMSRWTLIEGYHAVGAKLVNKNGHTVTALAEDLGRPKRHLRRCRQFFRKYPDLNLLPEGKNTSWHKIVNKYLPETTTKKEPSIEECPHCHTQWAK